MYLKQNPTLKYPKRAMAKAENICMDFGLFHAAEDSLQRAVDEKNARSEMYWRKVFGAFAHIVLKRPVEDNPWHLYNTAALYAYGGHNPRPEPDVEGERENEEYNRMLREAPYPESDPVEGDDQIPFD
jgi:hypothetical protein